MNEEKTAGMDCAREPEIQSELSQASRQMDMLSEAICALRSKVAPVMREQCPTIEGVDSEKEQPPETSIGNEVRCIRNNAINLRHEIEDFLNRIEL